MALIIIIDDDPELREMLEESLVTASHHVITATNGKEGLRLADAYLPDIAITDIIMPEMEGLETIQQLRAKQANLKIIAISGAPESWRVLDMAAALGAVKTIAKPFTPQQVLDAVNEVVRTS